MPALRTAGRAAALGAVAAAALGHALRHAGATPAEAGAALPGDALVPSPVASSTRARTLRGPPTAVWPWLVQLGYGRAGWYAVDELEALLGVARSTAADGTTSWRSLEQVVPAHQDLAVGDEVPLSPAAGFTVAALVPAQHLVLELHGGGALRLAWSWAFVLRPAGDGTRLLVRTRVGAARPLAPLVHALVVPGHAMMELVQLRNLARRVSAGGGRP